MAGLERELRAALGPTDLFIDSDIDSMSLLWEAGLIKLIVMDVSDARAGRTPTRFLIYFAPTDSFGLVGELELSYALPLGTTSSDLVAALVHEVRRRRHGLVAPSPYRWGLTRTGHGTAMADLLADAGCVADRVTEDSVTVWHRASGWQMWIHRAADGAVCVAFGPVAEDEDADEDFLWSLARRWTFADGAPSAVWVETAEYWLRVGPTAPPPAQQDPFPLPRVALTDHLHAGLGPLVQRLHGAGLEVLRVDLAGNRFADEEVLAGRDVVTFRDHEHRLLMLSRAAASADPDWSLHGLAVLPESLQNLSRIPIDPNALVAAVLAAVRNLAPVPQFPLLEDVPHAVETTSALLAGAFTLDSMLEVILEEILDRA